MNVFLESRLSQDFEEYSNTSWKDALRSLWRAWMDFARITGASGQWVFQALGATPPANQFSNYPEALEAFEAHALYGWLKNRLPHTMKQVDSLSTAEAYELIWDLLSVLITASHLAKPKDARRADKQRRTDLAAASKHPQLLQAVRVLDLRGSITGVRSILEIAKLLDIRDCDQNAARRYARLAREDWDVHTNDTGVEWLNVLEELMRDFSREQRFAGKQGRPPRLASNVIPLERHRS